MSNTTKRKGRRVRSVLQHSCSIESNNCATKNNTRSSLIERNINKIAKCKTEECNTLTYKTNKSSYSISGFLQFRISNKNIQAICLLLILTLLRLSSVQALINGVTPTHVFDSYGRSDRLSGTQSTTAKAGTAAINYFSKFDNMAAMLMKSVPGSQTTKRSLSEQVVLPVAASLTTIPPPLLTTLRYSDKFPHQQQLNLHHRNYELDLERDHALPTSAPNADILKSNSNPTYPNPNRHQSHERDRHRHLLNSTPVLSNLPNLLKKNNNGQMNGSDMPLYSPPARAFFTPPLPPEYQNPFGDKPTLRDTHNEGIVPANAGNGVGSQSSYINRRPIPPPSLMPGHERIPLRPPDTGNASSGNESNNSSNNSIPSMTSSGDASSGGNSSTKNSNELQTTETNGDGGGLDTKQEILPSIRRILSGSNGNKGEIPEVLLKQVTLRPVMSSHQPPSSPVVLLDSSLRSEHNLEMLGNANNAASNINHKKTELFETKQTPLNKQYDQNNGAGNGNGNGGVGYPLHMGSIASSSSDGGATIAAATATSSSTTTTVSVDRDNVPANGSNSGSGGSSSSGSSSSSTSTSSSSASGGTFSSATSSTHSTWTIAWNVHVYLSVILFTILAVYSFYKLLTYNKLTHLFPQSYFLCIHLVLITISTARIFYLCYDAYNIHASFQLFVSELLLNLPATLLTISFSVLMLFLFRKSLNHKHNRYSALIRPLTVIVGCGVHVVLCITLHYVESYTMQNYYQQQQQQQQQQIYYQQQIQRQRQMQQMQQMQHHQQQSNNYVYNMAAPHLATTTTASPPPRVLSLICQIIYIFVCLSLGLLYLYLYRILKRILRSKSQNYIHGYQNLSYAIHITIATALLFVLLALLQVFGAIGIAAKRPLAAVAEIDWLQWGYQFSLRLIEVAIITLISWVAGLKTKSSGGGGGGNMPISGSVSNGGIMSGSGREKFGTQRHHHTVVAGGNGGGGGGGGFFLPCTSTSSQEQFETDYPAVCSANTNLHTYTMRTGKLIYDDSFALNAMGQGSTTPTGKHSTEFHHHPNSNYQRPYDTNSLRSAGIKYQQRYPQHAHHQHQHQHQYATTDYLTDATTDHYENPNFDLQTTANPNMKFTKTNSSATSTTTASSKSGGVASGASSQQQMLLLQSESCYSEPNYDFNNFERPKFSNHGNQRAQPMLPSLDNVDRRSNSNSCASSGSSVNFTTYGGGGGGGSSGGGGGGSSSGVGIGGVGVGGVVMGNERRSGKRFASYNSFERGSSRHASNGVRKSGTLNNIVNGGKHQNNATSGALNQHQLAAEICYRNDITNAESSDRDYNYEQPPTLERSNSRTPLQMHHHHHHPHRSELEDDKTHLTDDITLTELEPVSTTQPAAI